MAESGPRIFDPNEMMTPEQRQERVANFANLLFKLAVSTGRKEAEIGAMLADSFSELCQSRDARMEAIATAKKIFRIVEQKYGKNLEYMLVGLLGELATAELLYDMEGVSEIKYPEIDDDLRRMMDWRVLLSGGQELVVQSKTLSYATEREQSRANISVLSSVKTTDDLKNFLTSIERASNDFIIILDGKPIKRIRDLNQTNIDPRRIRFSILPDTATVNVPKPDKGDADNRLEEICSQSVRMHSMYKDSDEIPVLCLLGSHESVGSDINSVSGSPAPSARSQAEKDLNEMITKKA